MELHDAVVIVTGASSGIGREIARALGEAGALPVLAARDAAALEAIAAELGRGTVVPTDVTDAGQAAAVVDQTVSAHGRIDALVNCAGRAMAAPVERVDLDQYRDLLELNVVAPLRLMQLVIPHFRAQGRGAIVNVSSQASTKYIPFIAGYASTKFALNNLTLTARQELARDNIAVSLIKPGIVDTEFGQHTPSPEPASLRRTADGSLLPHVISPRTVAEGVLSLLRSGEAELEIEEP